MNEFLFIKKKQKEKNYEVLCLILKKFFSQKFNRKYLFNSEQVHCCIELILFFCFLLKFILILDLYFYLFCRRLYMHAVWSY